MSQRRALGLAFIVLACDPGWDYEHEAGVVVEDGAYEVPHKYLGVSVLARAAKSSLTAQVTLLNKRTEVPLTLDVPHLVVLDKRGVALPERSHRLDCPQARNSAAQSSVVEFWTTCKLHGEFEIQPQVAGLIGRRDNPDLETITVKVLFDGPLEVKPIIIPLAWD